MLTQNELIEAEREYCKRGLANFAKQAWHVLEPSTELKWGWALDCVCEHLEAITDGRIKKIVINVPPGCMKSLLVNVIWPAWEWGPKGRPEIRYLATAHKEALALRDNIKCRRLIDSIWYQELWPIELRRDQNAKAKFENSKTGFRESMSFTSMTGSRGDRVQLDDPHSVDDAHSVTKLAGDVLTFKEALPTRVNNADSATIIIMQRLNEGDISAEALQLGYDHLCLPMRYEVERSKWVVGSGDPRTVDGELLFPERFAEQQVKDLELSLGAYATASQLQQRPAPRGGGMFQTDKFQIVDALPADAKESCRAWDLGATAGGGDPTAGVKMHKAKDGYFYISDVAHGQYASDKVRRLILQTAQVDGVETKVRMPQDPGQAGKAQAADYVRLLAGFSVKAQVVSGDKVTRADPLSAQVNAGNIRLVRGAWNKAFIDELALFPNGKHDDQVDAAADAFNELAGDASFNWDYL